MVKRLIFCLSFLVSAYSAKAQWKMRHPNSYYFPENWPAHQVQFSKIGTLKDLYDSGLRPYSWPESGITSSQLEIKHVRLSIRQSNGVFLPELPVERADIIVLTKGLSQISFRGQPLTIKQAYQQALPWLPVIGKTEQELKDFLSKVEADYSGFDDPDFGAAPDGFGSSWRGTDGERYGFILEKARNEVVPVRIALFLDWDKLWVQRDRESYQSPIPPPPGYENDPIKVLSDGFGPDDMNEMIYSKGIAFPPGTGLGGSTNDVIEIDEQGRELNPRTAPMIMPAPYSPRPSVKKAQDERPWKFIGLSILFCLAALLFFSLLKSLLKKDVRS